MGDDDFLVSPEILLRAYAAGVFPMAESADDPSLHWVEPKLRGIIPLNGFHLSARMERMVKAETYQVVADRDFPAVIEACAAPRAQASETWINGPIRALYGELFRMGFVHTVEVYDGEMLVGGLYGVALGSAFFGESMFHRARDCSKLALVHLVARLKAGGFTLLDTQFITDHLKQFGCIEIPKRDYRKLLDAALQRRADYAFWPCDETPDAAQVLAALAG